MNRGRSLKIRSSPPESRDPNPWHLHLVDADTDATVLPVAKSAWHSTEGEFWGDDPELQQIMLDVPVKAAVAHTRVGSYVLKYTRKRWKKPHERFFQIDFDYSLLIWVSPKKLKSQTCIALHTIVEVVPGWKSPFFKKKFDREKAEIRNLGIEIVTDKRKRLRLLCPKLDVWKLWCKGLMYASRKARQRKTRETEFDDQYVQRLWAMAGLSEETSMYFDALLDLLVAIGVVADGRYVWEIFESFNVDGSSNIEFDELMPMLERLFIQQDVLSLFERYANQEMKLMSEEEFTEFLQDVQQASPVEQQMSLDFMRDLREPFIKEGHLTHIGFCYMLTTKANSILSPARTSLYQDMSKSFTDYWIATYIFDETDSLRFGSTATPTEALKELLICGARCVHFYLVDGPEDEPCIYLKSGARFTVRDALMVIKRFAFLNSPYPFIISFSVGLSARQKVILGQTIQEIIGSQLVTWGEAPAVPSPSTLQEKFLIRTKKIDRNGAELPEGTEHDDCLQSQQRNIKNIHKFWADPLPDFAGCLQPPFPPLTPRSELKPVQSPRDKLKSGGLASNLDVLYNLVFFRGIPLDTLSTKKLQRLDVAMINNDQFYELTRESKATPELVRYSKNVLCFVYSTGKEFSPVKPWMFGAQFVSVYYQSRGWANLLQSGRFVENGGCGYVLKPPLLRQQREIAWDPTNPLHGSHLREAEEIPIELSIKILAAKQLPIPWQAANHDHKMSHPSGYVNPFVKVSIVGIPMDCDSRQTIAVTGNGFNPRWESQQFVFEITVPSLAMLVFEVGHFDTLQCDLLASAAVPIMAVQQGFRWVSLKDMMLRDIRWSGLLCQISVKAAKSKLLSARGSSDGTGFRGRRNTFVIPELGVRKKSSTPHPAYT